MSEWPGYEGLTGSFRKACWKADKNRKRTVSKPIRPSKFPISSIHATLWLMTFQPERLDAWLDKHPPGLLEASKSWQAKEKPDGG